jgi:D-alanyl-D-alanine dipeptidase
MPPDQDQRRAYWTEQLERAHDFMQQVLVYPVQECGEKLVALAPAAREAGVRIEFSTAKHVLGLDRLHYLRVGQIDGFLAAGAEMNRRGWVMKVEDGFRSRPMQKFIGRQPAVFDAILRSVIWELNGATPSPEFFRRRSMTLVALRPKVGTHMSGSAIDISVFRLDNGLEVDRGGPYLEMSERTPMASPFVSPEARENRRAITALMRAHGFVDYPYEFWHYNGGDAYEGVLLGRGQPARYGPIDWNETDGSVQATADPDLPLNSTEEFEQEIARALIRLGRCPASPRA